MRLIDAAATQQALPCGVDKNLRGRPLRVNLWGSEARELRFEVRLKTVVEHRDARLQQSMRAVDRPSHLLPLRLPVALLALRTMNVGHRVGVTSRARQAPS